MPCIIQYEYDINNHIPVVILYSEHVFIELMLSYYVKAGNRKDSYVRKGQVYILYPIVHR